MEGEGAAGWKGGNGCPWWAQSQDKGEEMRVDMSRLLVTMGVQILKQCCYYGEDTNIQTTELSTPSVHDHTEVVHD